MDYGLKDKVVLVTGSTKGLGKAIAELIAQEGGIPVVTGRREKEVHKIMMELREKYQDERIQGYCVDFSELSSVDFIFDVIKKDLGSIDVLINNAGIWPTAYVVDMKPEDFERTPWAGRRDRTYPRAGRRVGALQLRRSGLCGADLFGHRHCQGGQKEDGSQR